MAAAETRPLVAADQLELQPGAEGIIADLVATTAGGGQHTPRFDTGNELEIILPAALGDVDDAIPADRSDFRGRWFNS